MQHGRDHEEREKKLRSTRTRNPPGAESLEAEILEASRSEIPSPEEAYGMPEIRTAAPGGSDELRGEPAGPGSDVAPTRKAQERERERHRLERELGRTAAGEGGHVRDTRTAEVTREQLDEAGRKADEKVAGHPIVRKP